MKEVKKIPTCDFGIYMVDYIYIHTHERGKEVLIMLNL